MFCKEYLWLTAVCIYVSVWYVMEVNGQEKQEQGEWSFTDITKNGMRLEQANLSNNLAQLPQMMSKNKQEQY